MTPRKLKRVRAGLEALYAQTDFEQRRAQDPVGAVHRYSDPLDQELAGFIAASFAYGRVASFQPVIDRVLGFLDECGGPRAGIEGLDLGAAQDSLGDLVYRFNRGQDVLLLLLALRGVLQEHGSLEAAAAGESAHQVMGSLVQSLLHHAMVQGGKVGVEASTPKELPRGYRYWMTHPGSGSACKRLTMYLRWMIRPATEGLDLGIWKQLEPAQLLIPVDTHVLRTANFLGLSKAKTGSWRVAEEITGWLRKMDPVDPVRYDFAMAHLGISGACKGKRDPVACPACPLDQVCGAR
jgi:uncharacterized protein (TIGR02757 family)